MCGIAGIVSPGAAASPEVLDRMVSAMAHRGPDGAYVWGDGEVALGMRRLAIVDVSGGAQPLRDESGSISVVFNGEIYNHRELRAGLHARGHRLRSLTDGEVIPHLYEEYGPELFKTLDGIFAVAIWDSESRTLILGRDRMGVKPLYFYADAAGLRFASELRALLQDPTIPRRLDVRALDEHLTYRFTPAPGTLLEGVEKLEPSTVLTWRAGAIRRERYGGTDLPLRTDISFDDAADGFLDHLRSAVHRQMMSDRPIGAMLSGGVDSAAVVALMAERSTAIQTFTVGFEGGGDADETALARETASLFGTQHHELIVGQTDFAAELPSVIETLEEPVGTSSALGVRVIAKLARDHVPVLLSGQGADELLAGYWRYVGEWLAGRAMQLPWPLRPAVPVLARAARHVRSARLERGLRALACPDTLERFMDIYAVLTESQKRALYSEELWSRRDPGPASSRVAALLADRPGRDPLDQMMYVDLRLWLPDDLLLVADKMSMAESVEVRVPFLDPALVAFTESLPSSYKLRFGRRKAVEKAALAPLLPKAIIHRRERGFATPVGDWLRTSMNDFAREVLLDRDARCADLFRRPALEELLRRHRDREFDHTRQIFCLLSVELWAQRFLAVTGPRSNGAGGDHRQGQIRPSASLPAPY